MEEAKGEINNLTELRPDHKTSILSLLSAGDSWHSKLDIKLDPSLLEDDRSEEFELKLP